MNLSEEGTSNAEDLSQLLEMYVLEPASKGLLFSKPLEDLFDQIFHDWYLKDLAFIKKVNPDLIRKSPKEVQTLLRYWYSDATEVNPIKLDEPKRSYITPTFIYKDEDYEKTSKDCVLGFFEPQPLHYENRFTIILNTPFSQDDTSEKRVVELQYPFKGSSILLLYSLKATDKFLAYIERNFFSVFLFSGTPESVIKKIDATIRNNIKEINHRLKDKKFELEKKISQDIGQCKKELKQEYSVYRSLKINENNSLVVEAYRKIPLSITIDSHKCLLNGNSFFVKGKVQISILNYFRENPEITLTEYDYDKIKQKQARSLSMVIHDINKKAQKICGFQLLTNAGYAQGYCINPIFRIVFDTPSKVVRQPISFLLSKK